MLFTQGQEIPRSLLVSHSGSKCNYTLHIVVYCHFENLVVCKILCVITTPAVKEGMYHASYFTLYHNYAAKFFNPENPSLWQRSANFGSRDWLFFWPVTPMDTSGEQRVDFDMNPLNGIMMKFKLHFNWNQCSPLSTTGKRNFQTGRAILLVCWVYKIF